MGKNEAHRALPRVFVYLSCESMCLNYLLNPALASVSFGFRGNDTLNTVSQGYSLVGSLLADWVGSGGTDPTRPVRFDKLLARFDNTCVISSTT